MELTGLFPIIRRWLKVILGATVLAAVLGLVFGSLVDKTYEARAEMLVGPLSTDNNTQKASGNLAQTYAQLATSDSVLATVSRDLEVDGRSLREGVRATANSTTRFLIIAARSKDKAQAADIANAVALQMLELGAQDPTRPEGQLRVIDPAIAPIDPVAPRLDLIIPLAAVAGLLGSVTLVLLFEFIGDTAESVDKVEAAAGIPALVVHRHAGRLMKQDPLDAFRVVATQADLAAPKVRCVVVTGTSHRDGTGALTMALAGVWAERRPRVTIVDAISGRVWDWSELTTTSLDDDVSVGTADILPTRSDRDSPEAIDADTASHIIDELSFDGGLVIVRAGPATISAATLVWARAADVTILAVRRFQARRAMISDAAVNLRNVGANLAFSVLHERAKTDDEADRLGLPSESRISS